MAPGKSVTDTAHFCLQCSDIALFWRHRNGLTAHTSICWDAELTHICSNIRWLVEKILSQKSIPASTSAASHYLVSAPRPTWKKDIVTIMTTDDQKIDDDDDKDILNSVNVLTIKAPLKNLAMVAIVKPNLVTSPSFLSTARALLSIHCRESMCAFNTCKKL